ncbi:MAG: D-alanine--D-alanine ligase [Kiritimatiellae bacterium]|nr:D-alanine--D-alanine ligase [Kiritimatiellia bacterium]
MNRRYNQVAVLMGGPSKEYEISLRSGRAVAEALRAKEYVVQDVVMDSEELTVPAGVEAVFLTFHGTFGEDGTAQRLLEEKGIPYTGSGPKASRLSFDKQLSHEVLGHAGLPIPDHVFVTEAVPRAFPLPCVLKPLRQGSSLGVHLVFEEGQWAAAFAEAVSYDGVVLVEEYIPGHELTVGLVNGQALPVIEIIAPQGNFDYTAKYTKGKTSYICPAEIPDSWSDDCRKYALKAYEALGCEGMSRMDFRVTQAGRIVLLENNTIPGFTETSLLPKAAAAAGIPFPDLCDTIMQTAAIGKA